MSDTIASILEREPDWGALPADDPAARARAARALPAQGPARAPARHRRGAHRLWPRSAARTTRRRRPRRPRATRGRGVPPWAAVAAALALAVLGARPRTSCAPTPVPRRVRRLDLVADGDRDGLVLHPRSRPTAAASPTSRERSCGSATSSSSSRARSPTSAASRRWAGRPTRARSSTTTPASCGRCAVEGGAPPTICEVPGTGNVIGAAVAAGHDRVLGLARRHVPGRRSAAARPRCCSTSTPTGWWISTRPTWLAGGRPAARRPLEGAHRQHGRGAARRWRCSTAPRRAPIAGDIGGAAASPTLVRSRLLYVRRDANAGIWAVPFDAARARLTGSPSSSRPGRPASACPWTDPCSTWRARTRAACTSSSGWTAPAT